MSDRKPLTEEQRAKLDGYDVKNRRLALMTFRAAGFDISPYGDWLATAEKKAVRRAAAEPRPSQVPGVGDVVKRFLSWVPGAYCARCAATAEKMNAIGPAKCREQLDELAAEMVENFKARGILALAVDYAAKAIGLPLPDYCRGLIVKACDEVEASLGLAVDGLDRVGVSDVEVVGARGLSARVVERGERDGLPEGEQAHPERGVVRERESPVHEVIDPLHASAALTLSPSTPSTLPKPAAPVNDPTIARGMKVTP